MKEETATTACSSAISIILATLITIIIICVPTSCDGQATWMSLGMIHTLSDLNELQPISGSKKQHLSTTATTSSPVLHELLEQQRLMETLQNQPCAKLFGLSKGQQQLCQLYRDHMPHVGRGAREGIAECQYQFHNQRWNCSTFNDQSVFGPILMSGSRETSFAHSISAAGVVHAVARACREGQLSNCGCSRAPRPKTMHKDWIWGGCGDNIEYGYRFAETFIDVKEKEKTASSQTAKEEARKLMNLHNNGAGRRAVIRKTKVTCKCHGVSGSCSLVTCWQQLPTFREVGDFLKSKYDAASEVRISKRGKLQVRKKRSVTPTAEDLVFLENSPDYCSDDKLKGTFGTQGRPCNRTSKGSDGCGIMCCGRGYTTLHRETKQRCNCRFNWCCYVQCETCTKKQEIHVCK